MVVVIFINWFLSKLKAASNLKCPELTFLVLYLMTEFQVKMIEVCDLVNLKYPTAIL